MQSVDVKLVPPDIEISLEEQEIKELVDMLHSVVIYNQDDSYSDYAGQSICFVITKTDDTEIMFNAYNPFMIIDHIGYKTKYGPCEKLSSWANNLIVKEKKGQ